MTGAVSAAPVIFRTQIIMDRKFFTIPPRRWGHAGLYREVEISPAYEAGGATTPVNNLSEVPAGLNPFWTIYGKKEDGLAQAVADVLTVEAADDMVFALFGFRPQRQVDPGWQDFRALFFFNLADNTTERVVVDVSGPGAIQAAMFYWCQPAFLESYSCYLVPKGTELPKDITEAGDPNAVYLFRSQRRDLNDERLMVHAGGRLQVTLPKPWPLYVAAADLWLPGVIPSEELEA